MRVLDERNDIADTTLFFKKSGFITKEWYPYFLSAERFFGGAVFEEADKIPVEAAYEIIKEQILRLNPAAQEKKISKFING